jgi:hypothetical protein
LDSKFYLKKDSFELLSKSDYASTYLIATKKEYPMHFKTISKHFYNMINK